MLCSFASQFPPFVAGFLQQSRPLRRRFREETVTDLMMGCLLTSGLGRILVEFPNEPVTGADMEWNFVDVGKGTFFRILVQAKQAFGAGKKWRRHSYRELFHVSGGKLQLDTLCKTARAQNAFPLFALYHANDTCILAQQDQVALEGVNLVDAFLVDLVTQPSKSSPRRKKSVGLLSPWLFTLADIFCPPSILSVSARPFALAPQGIALLLVGGGIGIAIPPGPEDVRSRLVSLRQNADPLATLAVDPIPEISTVIPPDVLAGIDRYPELLAWPERRSRWRVTFVSDTLPSELDGTR